VSVALLSTVGILIQQDTWHHLEHRTLVITSIAMATDASGDPVFSSVRRQRLYFVEGLINSPFAGHGWELSTL
jgi:hypothetical protein